MITQPIRAWSLKFVTTLRANKPSQTLHEVETFFAKYRILAEETLVSLW